MSLPMRVQFQKVPSWLSGLVASRIGATRSTLDLTPNSMELSLESTQSWVALRCILRLWPGTKAEASFILADLQFHGRRWYLERWLQSVLHSEPSFHRLDLGSSPTTLR